MPVLLFKNFEAASRKRNMIGFGMFPLNTPLSWIDDNVSTSVQSSAATYGTTVTFNWDEASAWSVTLTGDVTTSYIKNAGSTTNFQDGDRIAITIIQNATGGWNFALPSTVVYASSYSISLTASNETTMYLQWRSGGWHMVAPPVEGPSS